MNGMCKIATLGLPVLRQKARSVDPRDIQDPSLQKLIDGMIETMRKHGGVGIAAPQVSVSKRIFSVECRDSKRYAGVPDVPLYTVINPRVRILDRSPAVLLEGCLSVPDLRGPVPRAKKLLLTGLDRRGKPLSIVARGFHARIIQHEFDHLEGKIFLDRMKGMRELSYLEHLR